MSSYSRQKFPRLVPWYFTLLLFAPCVFPTPTAHGDAVVIANRTREQVSMRFLVRQQEQRVKIPSGQLHVVPVRRSCDVHYKVSGTPVCYRLDANSVYFFTHDEEGRLDLRRVAFGAQDVSAAADHSSRHSFSLNKVAELPIKILVDNRDPRPRQAWEDRLRKRIADVSQILERHCRLQLRIVAVETWDSGDKPIGFRQTLAGFRGQVDPAPGHLAIGFTGQYRDEEGLTHLGVTHGVLQSHILIREWAGSMTEPERTEVLLHEIGHYLGAVHSDDPNSVMRPILADKKAIQRSFHIGFDPVNTLIINLMADEIRHRGVDSVSNLSRGTHRRLQQIYKALSEAAPEDKSIRQFIFQLQMVDGSPLSRATRQVVHDVSQAAPSRHLNAAAARWQLSTDQLTKFYVRQAAAAATDLPKELGPSAFLLGLGIVMDDSDILLGNPVTAGFCQKVESTVERRARQRALGRPTLRGRRDLTRHFFLSAYLTVAVGAPAAESAGLAKELADSRSQSGFSYQDLAADIAGIRFAQHLLEGSLLLSDVADRRTTLDLMPEVEDLPEGIPWRDISGQHTDSDKRSIAHYRAEIRRRVQQLSRRYVGPTASPER